MDNYTNFQDIIKKSFLNVDTFNGVSVVEVLINMFVALLLGLFIHYIYRKTFRGVVYSANYNLTLLLATLITTLIVMTISTNVALSLGMVGALSIVRFRTAVKEPLDIIYMFWAIAAGISAGASIFLVSIIGSLFIGAVIYFMSKKELKAETYLLVIHHEEEATDQVKAVLGKLKYKVKSKLMRRDVVELTVEIEMKGDNTPFMNQLKELEGVLDVSLIQYSGDYAA